MRDDDGNRKSLIAYDEHELAVNTREQVFRAWFGLTCTERILWQEFNVLRAIFRVKWKNSCFHKWSDLQRLRGEQRATIIRILRIADHSQISLDVFSRWYARVRCEKDLISRVRKTESTRIRFVFNSMMAVFRKRHVRIFSIGFARILRDRASVLIAWWKLLVYKHCATECQHNLCRRIFDVWRVQLVVSNIRLREIRLVFGEWCSLTVIHSHLHQLCSTNITRGCISRIGSLLRAIRHDRRRLVAATFRRTMQRFHSAKSSLFFRIWFIRTFENVTAPLLVCKRRVFRSWKRNSRRTRLMNGLHLQIVAISRRQLLRTLFELMLRLVCDIQSRRQRQASVVRQRVFERLSQFAQSRRIMRRRAAVLSNRLRRQRLNHLFREWILVVNSQCMHSRFVQVLMKSVLDILKRNVSRILRKRICIFRAERFSKQTILKNYHAFWARYTECSVSNARCAYNIIGAVFLTRRCWNSWLQQRSWLREKNLAIKSALKRYDKMILRIAFQVFLVYTSDKRTEMTRLSGPVSNVFTKIRERRFSQWRRDFVISRNFRLRVENISEKIAVLRKRTWICTWMKELRMTEVMHPRETLVMTRQTFYRFIRYFEHTRKVYRGSRLKFFLAWIVGVERQVGLERKESLLRRKRCLSIAREVWMAWKYVKFVVDVFVSKKGLTRRKVLDKWIELTNKQSKRERYLCIAHEGPLRKAWLKFLEGTRRTAETESEMIGRIRRMGSGCVFRAWVLSKRKRDRIKMIKRYFGGWKGCVFKARYITSGSTTPGLEIAQISHVHASNEVSIEQVLGRLFQIKQKISLLWSHL